MSEVLLTTNPGLEDVVAEEFLERIRVCGWTGAAEPKPYGVSGYTLGRCEVDFARLRRVVMHMHSVYHVLRPIHRFRLSADRSLTSLVAGLRQADIPELRTARSFRVSAQRVGEHPFRSPDIMRVAGAVLVEKYGCRVDLTGYELNVRVDVYEDVCVVSLQETREPLDRRYPRAYHHRAALKTVVAYGLLRLARLADEEGALLDPFCGSGTILLEAAHLLPRWQLYGSDIDPRAVAGAQQNITLLGLSERVAVQQANALRLSEVYPAAAFTAIVTNPPFGVRVGRGLNFRAFYHRFLQEAAYVLQPAGRLVLLVRKRGAFNAILDRQRVFSLRHVRIIETSGIYPGVFVLEKR